LAQKLIAGLGNPGPQYQDTRHNLGFMVIDELARRHNVKLKNSAKWSVLAAKVPDVADGLWLAKPYTFMNSSGTAVRGLCAYHKISPSEDLLVVVDDADLPLGKLRIRAKGSAGGHNGLKSIIFEFGHEEFPRLRVGVGRQPGQLKNHVLGSFGSNERPAIDAAVKRAADAAELFAKENILAAMNRFNAAQVDEDQA
jgi:PTH1 family peptidyl-tRNA hydrolase